MQDDIETYPIVIRPTGPKRAFLVGAFGALGAVFAGLAIYLAQAQGDEFSGLFLVAVFSCAAVWFGYIAWQAAVSRLTFEADSVIDQGALATRELRRGDIAGYRPIGNGAKIRLVPRDETLKPIMAPASLLKRPSLSAWFSSIGDLDEQDLQTRRAEFAQDSRYGGSEEEKLSRLERLKKLAGVVSGAAVAVLLWAIWWPQPRLWVLGAAAGLPVLAVVLNRWSGGLLTLRADKTVPRPSLVVAVSLPAVAVALRAMADINMLDWIAALEWSIGAALALTALFAAFDEHARSSIRALGAVCGIALIYSFGAIRIADVEFDRAARARFPTTVVDMQIQSTKGGPRYGVSVAPWGPDREGEEIDVSATLYRQLKTGDTVCVYMGAGRFGLRWYDLGFC